MCGIIGCVGKEKASDVIIDGLKRLEYRGYDSSGIAVFDGEKINVRKKQGRISILEQSLSEQPLWGSLAIGHTRWATHGEPSDSNAHPFLSNNFKYAVVHNGIIENYLEIKEELVLQGVQFHSKTDSEVVCHLLESLDNGNPLETIYKAIRRLKGAFALGIINVNSPDVIFAAKKDNPLIVGNNGKEGYICSDINSLQCFLDKVVVLDNEQIAIVRKDSLELRDFDGNQLVPQFVELDKEELDALNGYDCYMDKEICEIPTAIGRAVSNYRNNKSFEKIDAKYLKNIKRINIVACGTALHAGLYGEKLLKKYVPNIDVHSEMASEFRYDDVLVDDATLTITVSQSGETADTLSSQRMVSELGGKTLTICNVATSSMVHYADYNLLIYAGPEVAVASTKAFNCQEMVFAMFVFDLALLRGSITKEQYDRLQQSIDELQTATKEVIADRKIIEQFSEENFTRKSVFYLGRGIDYCIAMEGSLKLKEISYIHCEAYPAGELKHGTLALIEENVLVIALVTQSKLIDKMCSSLAEVRTRGAKIMVITPFDDERLVSASDNLFKLPKTEETLSPVVSVIATQLIAYYIARAKSCDIDKPRNLAKSVTVE